MCYAIPGKVKRFEDNMVVVDYFGQERKAYNELEFLEVGDYIYAQGGFAIQKIDISQAESILAVWKETFFELQEVDLNLSRLALHQGNSRFKKILDRAMAGSELTKEEMLHLFLRSDPDELHLLYKTANFLRRKHLDNSCCVHGIIELSNICERYCAYCGISRHNTKLARYHMSVDEVVEAATIAGERYGFKAIVLQSGESSTYTIDELCTMIHRIKTTVPMLIAISFGEVGIDGLDRLYQAGARALLLRFEVSNPRLYARLHPGQSLEGRLTHLRHARKLGFLIMTGGLIGLPGQTDEDIVDDIMLTKELGAEMASFGPLLPHPATPCANLTPPDHSRVLKTLAIMRLFDYTRSKILVTTAFETLDSHARQAGLMAGANSVMLNVTPLRYRQHYTIYPKRVHINDELSDQITDTLTLLRTLGRAPTDLGVAY